MVRAARLAAVVSPCCVFLIYPLPMARVRTPITWQVEEGVPTRVALHLVHPHAALVPKAREENPVPSLWDTSRPSQTIWEWATPIFAFGATMALMVAMLAQSPVHAVAAQGQDVMETLHRAIHSHIDSTAGLPVTCNGDGELEHPMR